MSGQYPPPNPPHPYSRVPVPSQRMMPPWGHSPQSTPGLNMVGSSMNYFGSPHMGLRGSQSWVTPPQSHAKPTENLPGSANPMFGLQMLMSADNATRIPSEYQQEESMDLSSHTNLSKTGSLHPENNSDVLRNGAIMPVEVNGEVDRTDTSVLEVKESVVTSVIAANPLREGAASVADVNRSVETPKTDSSKTVIKPEVETTSSEVEPVRSAPQMYNEPLSRAVSSVFKSTSSIIPIVKIDSGFDEMNMPTGKSESVTDKIDSLNVLMTKDSSTKVESRSDRIELSENNTESENCLKVGDFVDRINSSLKLQESDVSFLESSALSVDTDESKLVVAESSAEDIFGISPVDNTASSVSENTGKSQDSKITDDPPSAAISSESSSVLLAVTNEKILNVNPPVPPVPEPQPSVENVEILLESMFNSQEDNSCSSQTSSCGIPQSVIVTSGAKITLETIKPSVDVVSPMKVEDLASTLAEGIPVDNKIKEEKKDDKVTDDMLQEIEKKLEMLTESVSESESQPGSHDKEPLRDLIKEETAVTSERVVETLQNTKEVNTSEVLEHKPPESIAPTQKIEAGTSSNPFIEVETELEKMFAGIVEPTEEGSSENHTQLSVSEPKKPDTIKRTVAKRKKANNRRPSDCSVFGGGSSSESTPVKKRGRKRVNDGGNDRGAKKIKVDNGETIKKKKLPKDISNDNLSGKVKGPFVHIEGPKESPSSVVVMNGGVRLDDEDGADKASARRKHSSVHRSEGVTSRKAYNSSTLSARYNSDTADLSWVCSLCHRGPHCQGGLGGEPAGDLFGPYRVPVTPPIDDAALLGSPSDRDIVEEQKRRGGKYPKSLRTSGGADAFVQKMGKKCKRSQSMESSDSSVGLLAVDGNYEVWLHGPCAEWAPGLCVVGSTLVGLEDAVSTAIRTKCSVCGEAGAGVGCVMRSCPARAHYPCAQLTGWLLDQDSFIARCHMHRTRLRPS